ncbi:MAG: DUF6785 family protein [Kiritimatiellia bacterium]
MSLKQKYTAIVMGAIGCLLIWLATPYNNFFLNNSFISDTYIPEVTVVFLLLVVLGLNPILHKVCPKYVLHRSQIALIFAMLLMGAVVPSQGLLRMLPWSLARTTQDINQTPRLANAIESAGIPQALFPEKIGVYLDTPVSKQFLDELEADATIPWQAWLRLVPVWGFFVLACWLLMIGVGLILLPEWKEKERLPFPLLNVFRSIFPNPQTGTLIPPLFRNRLFWTGAGIVMVIYALIGLHHHTHGNVPGFPIGWQLSGHFADPPWLYLPNYLKNVPKLFFVLIGIAYFMPNRTGFSIWFTTIAYGLYIMIGRSYIPGYYGGIITDHRNGAMIAVFLMVLYLSRWHWWHVSKLLFRRTTSDPDRLLKVAGWMLVAGACGMYAWLRWTGVPHTWAGIFVLLGFMVSVVISRIVAESGMPFVRIVGLEPAFFMAMVPAGWLTGAAIYMSGFINMLFQLGSRISAAVMVSHAASVDEEATPRSQIEIGYMMIAILMIGFVVGGVIHLHMGYTQGATIDGAYTPLNTWGTNVMRGAQHQLLRWSDGSWIPPSRRLGGVVSGILLAGGLFVACMMMPKWPLHPIGMLLVGHYYGNLAWASLMLGWTSKVLIIKYGGAKAFRSAQPLFLGLILGEIFSAVIWTLVPIILILLGVEPGQVGRIMILPT